MVKRFFKYFVIILSVACSLTVCNYVNAQTMVNADEETDEIEGEMGVVEVPDGFWGEPTPTPEVKPNPTPSPTPTPEAQPNPTPVPTPSPGVKTDVSDVFSDVKTGAWYKAGVQFVYDNGYMSGSNGLFNPTADITRAQIVTTLYRLAGEPKVTERTAVSAFSDITEGKYYTDAVCWAYTTGVTTGTDGKFNPTGKLTRQQMAAFFFRYAELTGKDTSIRGDISSMKNADQVSGYAKDPVEWAVGSGLISGSEVTDAAGNKAYDLNPRGNTTRAQVAVILQRFCSADTAVKPEKY